MARCSGKGPTTLPAPFSMKEFPKSVGPAVITLHKWVELNSWGWWQFGMEDSPLTLGNIWRHQWSSIEGLLLATREQKPWVLLSTLQCTGQCDLESEINIPNTKNPNSIVFFKDCSSQTCFFSLCFIVYLEGGAVAHVWRSDDNLWELVLSFHHVGPGEQTQAVSLGSKHDFTRPHLSISLLTHIII